MSENERNIDIIKTIINYCDEIADAMERFGDCYESLFEDRHYQNSVSMCVLQIGELAGRLTDDFKVKYNGVPWQNIKNMRNIAAHEYQNMNLDVLWRVISKEAVDLCEYCEKILGLVE